MVGGVRLAFLSAGRGLGVAPMDGMDGSCGCGETVWSTASNAVWFPAVGQANDGVGAWKASRKCEREREHDSQQIRLAYRERASMLLLLPPAVSLPTYCGVGEEEEKKAMMLLCFFTAYSVLTHLIICRDIHAR